ncbi:hypothetical protein [Archangium sp.]|jgi:hypothetical protein|uniref:hypothetical protein n=1 Tax=Archangium sp. TaxID=1872627 RepID=UPI002ED9EDEE
MRTYGFEDSKAHKSDSDTHAGGARYGRQHARTAELYHQRRLKRQREEQLAVNAVQPPPMGTEAPSPLEMPKQAVEPHMDSKPETSGHEGLRDRAQQAVTSVLQAARELHPLENAKKLAGEAVSGALRVVRQVSARAASRKSLDTTRGEEAKKGRKR